MYEEVEDLEEIPEWSEDEKEILIQKGLFLTQLLESPKFVQFLDMNYDIVREEGTKMMYVIEVPDEVALERAAGIMKEQAAAAPAIKPASINDIQKFTK